MAIVAPNIGIDLGTANTLLYVQKRGIVISEPTVVVIEKNMRYSVKCIGEDARSYIGRSSSEFDVVKPLSEGMIRDFDLTKQLLKFFVKKAIGASYLVKPKLVICVPHKISRLEKQALRQAALYAGAREKTLKLVDKPFAAALGSGLPVFDPKGSMIVDIGAGTTDVAVVSLGGIVVSRTINVGGDKMNEAIASYVKREFDLFISEKTSEEIKKDMGAALPMRQERKALIRGQNMIKKQPLTAEISSFKVYEALQPVCQAILGAVQFVLQRTPPELVGDILRGGIHLTGGGALLFGIEQYIASELYIPVSIAKDPVNCTVLGVGKLAESYDELYKIDAKSFIHDDREDR